MMKKNTLALVLAAVVSTTAVAGTLTGCFGGGETSVKPDATQTTYVKLLHYDAGFGRTYIEKTARAFEEAVKDVEYETGKKGVYIDIEHTQTSATGKSLLETLPSSPYDLFLSNGNSVETLKNSGAVMDLTSLAKAKSSDENTLSEYADETSIYERMFADAQENYTATDGKMYSLPVFLMSYHLYYDAQLVADRGLYIKDGSTDTQLSFTKNLAQAQKGVDGVKGTADDGLPETYDQFYLWLAKVEDSNITPMHYSGLYQQHIEFALQQFWADFEGKDNVKACWTFDGTKMKDLINVDDEGNVTYLPETEITLENGYMVQKQEGRYRVMQLAKKLADSMSTADKWIHNYAFSGSETHTEAQGTFVASKYSSKPILMFADGSYWEAEASDKFSAYESRNGGKLDRKIAVLPTPKYSRADVGEDSRTTVLADVGLDMYAHKHVETATNKQAVIDFLMYFNQAEQMDMQHAESASMRPYTYEIDSVVSANMSHMLKDYYALMTSERTDVVSTTANNDFVRANTDALDRYYWIFYSQFREDGDEKSYLSVKTFKENTSHEVLVTAEDYFNGFYRYFTKRLKADSKTVWEDMLSKIN